MSKITLSLLAFCFSVGLVFAGTTIQSGPEKVNKLVIGGEGTVTIEPEIYGHFAEHLGRCVYEGFWVGEDSNIPNVRGIRKDVVEALKKLNIPLLRWPGGCFADEYHWKDGIGPRDKRAKMINTHWGQVTETNAFGTHEFFDLCRMLGCKAYVAGNVGSGTVEEMQDWVEYITFAGDSDMANLRRANGRQEPWKLDYFGVGNENWGCGGNMTPEYYSDVYKRYQTYVRNLSGQRPVKIACGSNDADYNWMEVMMKRAGRQIDMISLHHYVMSGDWGNKGSATNFNESEWFSVLEKTIFTDEMITKCAAIMDKYDSKKKVGLAVDEWGAWWNVEKGENQGFLYQQNTLRDAVVAGTFLNIFNNHADRVKLGCIAQINNVLQAMILTDKEKMIVTPTYHVFEMYKVHQGAKLLPSNLECNAYKMNDKTLPSLSASASKDKNSVVHITLCNLDPQTPAELECELKGISARKVSGRILTGEKMNVHNTFEQPDAVKPAELKNIEIKDGKILATLPAKSVVLLTVE
jgi:alpha-N-arabinofuranosidase